MTPRERVLAALEHRRPDRTPRDFWAEPAAMNRLYAHVGHRDEERLLRSLGIDIRRPRAAEPPERSLGGGRFRNFWGEQYVYRATEWGPMREDLPGALSGARSMRDLESFDWPSPDCFDHAPIAQQCRAWDDYALLYGFADVWERPALVRGWENLLVDMVDRPEWAHWLCRRFTDFYVEDYTRAMEASGGRLDLFLLLTDLGTQRGPLISRGMFAEFVRPYLQRMIDCIHGLGARVLYHSCGDIAAFIPDLVEMGVDLLDPIQPVGPGMQPEALAAAYEPVVAFHGGIDTQGVLPYGTPDEVRREAERYCGTLGRSGGYILAPAHLFQPEVPPANIRAMYDVGL